MNVPSFDSEVFGKMAFTGVPADPQSIFDTPVRPGGSSVDPVPIPPPPLEGHNRRGLMLDPSSWHPFPLADDPLGGWGHDNPFQGGEDVGVTQDALNMGVGLDAFGNIVEGVWDMFRRRVTAPQPPPTAHPGDPHPTPDPHPVTPTIPTPEAHDNPNHHQHGSQYVEEIDEGVDPRDATWFQNLVGLNWWGPANELNTSPEGARRYAEGHGDSLVAQMDYAGYLHDQGVARLTNQFQTGRMSRAEAEAAVQANDVKFMKMIDALYSDRRGFIDGEHIRPWLMKHLSRMVMSPAGQAWQRPFNLRETPDERLANRKRAKVDEGMRYSTGPAPPKARQSALVSSTMKRRFGDAFNPYRVNAELSYNGEPLRPVRESPFSRTVRPWTFGTGEVPMYSPPRRVARSPISGRVRKAVRYLPRSKVYYHNPVILSTRKRKRKRVRFNV